MNSSHTTRTAVPSRRISTRDLAFAGMIAAILAIISQISVPMPTGVPITIQVFGITLIGVAFGWRLGLYGSLVYILLGAVGLPIFANIGLAINETAGGLQWAALAGDMSVWGVFVYSMTAFIPKDIVLTILAVIFGIQIRKTLNRAGITR